MIRVVLTTFAHADDAAKVIRTLVEERLAACGTILPGARSIYVWQGEIEDASEVFVLLKTSTTTLPAMEQRLLALHPYETPEIVAIKPDSVSSGYAAWVLENTSL